MCELAGFLSITCTYAMIGNSSVCVFSCWGCSVEIDLFKVLVCSSMAVRFRAVVGSRAGDRTVLAK